MGTVWMVRGGRQGERERTFLDNAVIGVDWDMPNLTDIQSKEQLSDLYTQAYPDQAPKTCAANIGQLWSFAHRMQVGELVVLPLKTTGTIAVGRIAGAYEYRTDIPGDLRHTRRVEWIGTDIARDAFDQDLLYSFGMLLAVGRVNREQAEERILATVEGKRPPIPVTPGSDPPGDGGVEGVVAPDIEAIAREQVRQYISRNFAGHDLARLVAAVLQARGFTLVEASEPGPDRGVDIMAGSGPMGLDAPRVVVQVKTAQAGVDEYRALRGVVESLRADHGLLVAWGGFKGTVRQEARPTFFAVRMWDADALIDELFAVYEQMSDDVRSELPLKRVWALVPTE